MIVMGGGAKDYIYRGESRIEMGGGGGAKRLCAQGIITSAKLAPYTAGVKLGLLDALGFYAHMLS